MKEINVIAPKQIENTMYYSDITCDTNGILVAFNTNGERVGCVLIDDEDNFNLKPSLYDRCDLWASSLEELKEKYNISYFKLYQ